jgi:hypothetical protein
VTPHSSAAWLIPVPSIWGRGAAVEFQVRAASSGRALLQLPAPSPPPPTAQYAVSFDGVDDYLQLPLVRPRL